MLNFDFSLKTRLVFGRDTHSQIGALLKGRTHKLLLHYGGGSVKKSGVYDAIVASLREAGIAFAELGGVRPNPRLELADAGIELCRKEGVDAVLAVGGGSVIDSAKAICAGVFHEGSVWGLYRNQTPIKKALPLFTVLTIPAAGSESSPNSVLSNEQTQQKLAIASPLLAPQISVVNPALFRTLPPSQVANGVCDMMCHIFERYFTPTPHTDVSDGLCESTLRAIMRNALIVRDNVDNYEAWCELAFAGTLAHNNLLGIGRVQDWASHRIEHELSALYDIAHGAGLAVVAPSWMRHVCAKHANLFAQFAVNVFGLSGGMRDVERTAHAGIDALEAFFQRMGLATRLSQLGIGDTQFDLMAKKAVKLDEGAEVPLGGLEKIRYADVLAILRRAL